jgi:cobalt-zinc-cadmium resistance protein CzcA
MGALDFGLLLEGTLVIVEMYLSHSNLKRKIGLRRFNKISKLGIIKKSAGSVASYIFFALLILIVVDANLLVPESGRKMFLLAFTLGYAYWDL